MAEAPLRLEYEYFPDPTIGRPVANGFVYVGVINTDPTVIGNRVDLILIQQDGSRVIIQPSAQPLRTTPGGVIEYNGSPAIIRVDGTVSIAVENSAGAQVYYNPTANLPSGGSGSGSATGSTGTPLNGSFELETIPGIADNWLFVANAGGTVEIDSLDSVHGFKSVKFTSTGAAGAGIATSDKFNVLGGSFVDLRATYKASSLNSLTTIKITYFDAVGTPVTTNTVYSEGLSNPANYSLILVRDAVPVNAIECEIILSGMTTGGATVVGTANFDNIELTNIIDNYEVGGGGSVLQTTDVVNSVNNMVISNGSSGISPTIDQIGQDDLGILIEQILLKNGIIKGDLVGDITGNVTGDVTGNLTGNADTVTVVPTLSGDVSNVGNVITLVSFSDSTVGSLSIKTGVTNVPGSGIPAGATINITEVGFLYISIPQTNNTGDLIIEIFVAGIWSTVTSSLSQSSVGAFVYSRGSNVRIRSVGSSTNNYSMDKIED